jgi:hypothetical protein
MGFEPSIFESGRTAIQFVPSAYFEQQRKDESKTNTASTPPHPTVCVLRGHSTEEVNLTACPRIMEKRSILKALTVLLQAL